MQTGFVAFCIFIPGMIDIFFYLFRRVGVYRMDLAQVTVEYDTPRTQIIFYTGISVQWEISIRQIVANAASDFAPFVFIDFGDHQ